MRRLSHIALFTALLLLLGHGFAPHQHQPVAGEQLQLQAPYQPNSLLGELFRLNLGVNHLEEVRLNELEQDFNQLLENNPDLGLAATYLTLPQVTPMPRRSWTPIQDDSLFQLLLSTSTNKRGPPNS